MAETPAWLDAALAYAPHWLGYQMRLTEQPGCLMKLRFNPPTT